MKVFMAARGVLAAVLGISMWAAMPVPMHAQTDAAAQPSQTEAGPGGRRAGRGIRGTVLSTSGANVVIQTETGEKWTLVTTENTRINIDRQPVKVAGLKAGDEVLAGGIPDADKHEIHALFVGGLSAAQAAKLKADLGKTYIVGRITAIDDVKLTVMRPDKVSQLITLDESTSLHRGGALPEGLEGIGGFGGGGGGRSRGSAGPATPNANSGGDQTGGGGEAITLADVKVGDNVAGSGSLKGSTFVPTDLRVQTPRPRPAGSPPPAR